MRDLNSNDDLLSKVTIQRIPVSQTLPLRSSVLWPGAPVERIHVPDDDTAHHFGAFIDGESEALSIISLFIDDIPEGIPVDAPSKDNTGDTLLDHPSCPIQARFRKFATDPKYQSRGIGSKLLEHVFVVARNDLCAKLIWCSARTSSLGWYQKRGMSALGETWMKGGHEYVKMKKEF